MVTWFVYLIECSNGKIYTGITTDVRRRFKEHLQQKNRKGAKFFRTTTPHKILFVESFQNRSLASKREYEIKKMGKSEKLRLATNNFFHQDLDGLLR